MHGLPAGAPGVLQLVELQHRGGVGRGREQGEPVARNLDQQAGGLAVDQGDAVGEQRGKAAGDIGCFDESGGGGGEGLGEGVRGHDRPASGSGSTVRKSNRRATISSLIATSVWRWAYAWARISASASSGASRSWATTIPVA
jgi:hypothetical protein